MENVNFGNWGTYAKAVTAAMKGTSSLNGVRQVGMDDTYASQLYLVAKHSEDIGVDGLSLHAYDAEDFQGLASELAVYANVGKLVSRDLPLIFGEFGGPAAGSKCVWFGTQDEMAALWIPQKAIAVIAAGGYAAAYWVFMGGPEPGPDWGTIHWDVKNTATCLPVYYSYGLMSRYFRGPADAWPITDVATPGALPAACVQQHDTKLWSVAALNVDPKVARELSLQLPAGAKSIRLHKFTYTSGDVTNGKYSDCNLPQPAPDQITVSSLAY